MMVLELVAAMLVSLALGLLGGMAYEQTKVAQCQADCARGGMVCSPKLHGGMDYCVFAKSSP